MKTIFLLASLCLIVNGLSAQQQPTTLHWRSSGDYLIADSVLIPARDGMMLSAMVVRKKDQLAALPVILQFTIYARLADTTRAIEAAKKGYVGMVAYSRGKRYSAGEALPYVNDTKDVYDVIDWTSKQSWCNGKVAMHGGSYNGFTQWAATKKLHPALKTIVPSAAVAPGLDVPMMNNVFMSFPFSWTYYTTNNKFLDETDYQGNHWNELMRNWYASGTTYPNLDSVLGRGENKIFRSWLSHPTYDAFWQAMIPYRQDFAQISIPVLSTTGYYDGGQVGAMYYFREHNRYRPNAEHYLIIGPYGHFGSQGFPDSVYRDYRIDSAARIPIRSIVYEWFDYILKGAAKPAFLKDRINYQLMGSNEWRHAASLQQLSKDSLTLYFSHQPKTFLSTKKPAGNGFTLQEVDFTDRSNMNSYFYQNAVVYDSLFPNNGVMFSSAPLEKEMDITGCFSGEMKVMINKRDIDFSVALFEQLADGSYFYLTYFMGRASYTKDQQHRQLLAPGVKTTLPFTNSYFCSKRLAKGSRIVAIVNVNKSAFDQINYGSGKEVNEETIADAKTPLQIKWMNDSFIRIPLAAN